MEFFGTEVLCAIGTTDQIDKKIIVAQLFSSTINDFTISPTSAIQGLERFRGLLRFFDDGRSWWHIRIDAPVFDSFLVNTFLAGIMWISRIIEILFFILLDTWNTVAGCCSSNQKFLWKRISRCRYFSFAFTYFGLFLPPKNIISVSSKASAVLFKERFIRCASCTRCPIDKVPCDCLANKIGPPPIRSVALAVFKWSTFSLLHFFFIIQF